MDNNQETKKCFCARCFLPIDAEDRVDIENQNFHRICSMCCICRTIPTTLKMFYGHVFCNECFKTHVLTRFKGENPRIHSNSWWMQWAPGVKPQDQENKESVDSKTSESPMEEPGKRCICARCLQPVAEDRISIGDQSFHSHCARCYFCRSIPKSNLKIYYGQVFCEDCFHRHVMSRNRDNPSEFFKNCFEQWQNNPQFAENMREFMCGNREQSPLVFMMQDQHPPFCRCGTGPQEWFQPSEPKKSQRSIAGDSTWDLSFENRTEVSDVPESIDDLANPENCSVTAAEKIEKLTKYLHERQEIEDKIEKKWKNFELDNVSILSKDSFKYWRDIQETKVKRNELECPKCLWQCGPIYVSTEYLQKKQIICEE
ncbi:uncharacterized protein LOC119838092 [Zerene cesonia]|uniref:uncharacterized protein LOC119838092 n=1 Tax=Zerene cesonia TaxID=33412 RepID=UPI0018E51208|nr:uncharacterized protein LOC119838092 [Zerene cesonia]